MWLRPFRMGASQSSDCYLQRFGYACSEGVIAGAYEYGDLACRGWFTQGLTLVIACGPDSNLLLTKLWPVNSKLIF
jgi:hypothetical protein